MKRKLAKSWIWINLMLDMVVMFLLVMAPATAPIYEMATDHKWNISPTWAGTVLPTIMALLYLYYVVKDINFTIHIYRVFTLISLGWAVELLIYEPLIGMYDWTKIVDAARWISIWFAFRHLYKNLPGDYFIHEFNFEHKPILDQLYNPHLTEEYLEKLNKIKENDGKII